MVPKVKENTQPTPPTGHSPAVLPCRDGGIRTHDPLTPSSQDGQRHTHPHSPRSITSIGGRVKESMHPFRHGSTGQNGTMRVRITRYSSSMITYSTMPPPRGMGMVRHNEPGSTSRHPKATGPARSRRSTQRSPRTGPQAAPDPPERQPPPPTAPPARGRPRPAPRNPRRCPIARVRHLSAALPQQHDDARRPHPCSPSAGPSPRQRDAAPDHQGQ